MEENLLIKADMEILEEIFQGLNDEQSQDAIKKALDTYTNFVLGDPQSILKRVSSDKFTKSTGHTVFIDPPGGN